MQILYLDIETLPAEESFKEQLRSGAALSRSKRLELERRGHPLAEKEVEALYRGTALSGEFGRILCVGLWLDPEDRKPRILKGPEPEILRSFWDQARNVDLFVGHNIINFDLRFIYKRSVVHRIRPTRDVPVTRYRHSPVFDTMHEWNRWVGELISLERLACALGLQSSKQDLSGDKVYDVYRAGQLERIYNYCKADVELTRQIHRRLAFLD